MRASRSVPALLLLVMVTAGLFAMHTLGHSGAAAAPMAHRSDLSMAMSMASSDMGMLDLSPVSVQLGRAPSDPGMPMGVLALCMAILGGVTVLVLISVLARRLPAWRPSDGRRTARIGVVVRGPPGTRMGLTLADLSVFRT